MAVQDLTPQLRTRLGRVERVVGWFVILATAGLFVPIRIDHPLWMIAFLLLTAVTFSLFGFIIGVWADGFEKLQVIPLLVLFVVRGAFMLFDAVKPWIGRKLTPE
jgi:ABC-2 type transport system permease protein